MDIVPTETERRVIEAAATGAVLDLRFGHERMDDPAKGAIWRDERIIRAEVITALCTEARPDWAVSAKGVAVAGLRILGHLDFVGGLIRYPLQLVGCSFEHPVEITGARSAGLSFSGSYAAAFHAGCIHVDGDAGFGVRTVEEVRLLEADIAGNLDFFGGRFLNPHGPALMADRAKVKGSVRFLGEFRATGAVRLAQADIGGDLDCRDSRFSNAGGDAFVADGAKVRGDLYMRDGFNATGQVRLESVEVGGVCHFNW
jgi:hypothetical protein